MLTTPDPSVCCNFTHPTAKSYDKFYVAPLLKFVLPEDIFISFYVTASTAFTARISATYCHHLVNAMAEAGSKRTGKKRQEITSSSAIKLVDDLLSLMLSRLHKI